jgi:hypothetical protein
MDCNLSDVKSNSFGEDPQTFLKAARRTDAPLHVPKIKKMWRGKVLHPKIQI